MTAETTQFVFKSTSGEYTTSIKHSNQGDSFFFSRTTCYIWEANELLFLHLQIIKKFTCILKWAFCNVCTLARIFNKEAKPTIPDTVTLTEGQLTLGGTVFVPSEAKVRLMNNRRPDGITYDC